MKLYNCGGLSDVEVIMPEGRFRISPEGTEIPDDMAEKILKRVGTIKKEPLAKKKKEVKKDGQRSLRT